MSLTASAGRSAVGRILWRVVTTLPVLWVVVTVVFLMIHLVPGDPIVQMLGDGATAGDIVGLRHAYGLDVPLGTWDSRCGYMIRCCT